MIENLTLLPALPLRMESGPLQFGDDWPGLFLRGDHAMHYAFSLKLMRDSFGWYMSPFDLAVINGLISDLESCEVKRTGEN